MYWLAICVATQTPGGPKPIPTLRKDDPVATRNLWTADDGTGQAEAGSYLSTGFGASLYRFISQDPIGDGDNWYAYADDSPSNEVDPLGLVFDPFNSTGMSDTVMLSVLSRGLS